MWRSIVKLSQSHENTPPLAGDALALLATVFSRPAGYP